MSLNISIQGILSIADAVNVLPLLKKEFNNLPESERKDIIKSINEMKKRIKPTHPEAEKILKLHCVSSDKVEKQKLISQYNDLKKTIMESAEGVEYMNICSEIDSMIVSVKNNTKQSNRIGRAKQASEVFNECAGRGLVPDAKVDSDGNAIGTEYDLGRDKSYTGCEIVILHQHCSENFTGKEFTDALKQKGFTVIHHWGKTPSVEELEKSLQTASQLWLISTNSQILSDKHIDTIVHFWKTKGLGLYIFGDNDPYYVDANRMLDEISKELFKKTDNSCLKMSGNSPGGMSVGPLCDIAPIRYGGFTSDLDTSKGGFTPNLICTGLRKLYEGITVAYFDDTEMKKCEFEPVLYDHCGKLITAYRAAQCEYGPIIVDGAFTRLWYNWKDGGTARYVRNCACILSTIVPLEEK